MSKYPFSAKVIELFIVSKNPTEFALEIEKFAKTKAAQTNVEGSPNDFQDQLICGEILAKLEECESKNNVKEFIFFIEDLARKFGIFDDPNILNKLLTKHKVTFWRLK